MIVQLFNSKENEYTFSCITKYALYDHCPVTLERNFIKFEVKEFQDFLHYAWKAYYWISLGLCRDDGQEPTELMTRKYFCSVIGYKDKFWFQFDMEVMGLRYGVC